LKREFFACDTVEVVDTEALTAAGNLAEWQESK
jgi:hypothetical protein